jgi:hypothetical protein
MDADQEHRPRRVLRVLTDALELMGHEVTIGEVEGHRMVEHPRLLDEEDVMGGRPDLFAGRHRVDGVGVLEVVWFRGLFPHGPALKVQTEAVSQRGTGLGDGVGRERPDR